MASRFFARGSGSGSQPGSFGASPASCQATPSKAGSCASRPARPAARSAAGLRSMPPKWPPRAVGEPAMTIACHGPRHTTAQPVAGRGHASCRHAPDRLRPRALLRALGVRRRAPAVRVGRPGLADGRGPGPGRRRDARAVGRPDPRLHRVDRPSAPASRDRRAVRRASSPTRCSSSPARRRPSSAWPTSCWVRATTPSSPGPATRACTRSRARRGRTSPSTSCARTPAGRSTWRPCAAR